MKLLIIAFALLISSSVYAQETIKVIGLIFIRMRTHDKGNTTRKIITIIIANCKLWKNFDTTKKSNQNVVKSYLKVFNRKKLIYDM